MARLDPKRWKILSPYLDEALALSADELKVWFHRLKQSLPDIESELRELLARSVSQDFDHFLTGEPSDLVAQSVGAALTGQRIGAYEIETEIGQGGMGSVWLARRADGRFDTRVAIKFVNLALLGQAGEQRFLREGRLLAQLAHRNIAALIDSGVTDSGQPYLILEYVDGQTIDVYCDSRKLTVEGRLCLFLDVVDAVAHAHDHLTVHRDVKPSNILVTADGTVKLLDFGVAKLLENETAGPSLTREGSSLLTPEFASPEQLLREPITTATDVYGLGVLLCLLLTGRRPHEHRKISAVEFLQKIANDEPRLASELLTVDRELTASAMSQISTNRSTRPDRLLRELRGELDVIIAKALKRTPEERYRSAAKLGDDIRHFLANEPISARPDSRRYRLRKFLQRNRLAVTAVAGLILTLTLATMVSVSQMFEAKRQRDSATLQAARAEATRDLLGVLFSEVGEDGRALRPGDLLKRAVELLDSQLGNDPVLALRVSNDLVADNYVDDNESIVKLLTNALEEAKGQDAVELVTETQCRLTSAHFYLDNRQTALDYMRSAMATLNTLAEPAVGTFVACGWAQEIVAESDGDFLQGITHLEAAKQALIRTGDTSSLEYANVLGGILRLYTFVDRRADAVAIADEVVTIHERAGRGASVHVRTALQNRAALYASAGQYLDAVADQKTIVEKLSARTAEGTVGWIVAFNYGNFLGRLERYDESLDWLTRAEIDAAADGPAHVGYIKIIRSLVAISMKDYAQAELLLDEAEDYFENDPIGSAIQLTYIDSARAEIRLKQNRIDEAERHLAEAFERLKYPGKRSGFGLSRALLHATRIQLHKRSPAEALNYVDEALTLLEKNSIDLERNSLVGEALMLRGQCQLLLGETENAKESLNRAETLLVNGLGENHSLVAEVRKLQQQV